MSTHSVNEKKRDTKTFASVKSLAKLMFSIGTTTSKVTKEDNMDNNDDSAAAMKRMKDPRKVGKQSPSKEWVMEEEVPLS
jgi:hypothetical protein